MNHAWTNEQSVSKQTNDNKILQPFNMLVAHWYGKS